jgi:hypothetical protein
MKTSNSSEKSTDCGLMFIVFHPYREVTIAVGTLGQRLAQVYLQQRLASLLGHNFSFEKPEQQVLGPNMFLATASTAFQIFPIQMGLFHAFYSHAKTQGIT